MLSIAGQTIPRRLRVHVYPLLLPPLCLPPLCALWPSASHMHFRQAQQVAMHGTLCCVAHLSTTHVLDMLCVLCSAGWSAGCCEELAVAARLCGVQHEEQPLVWQHWEATQVEWHLLHWWVALTMQSRIASGEGCNSVLRVHTCLSSSLVCCSDVGCTRSVQQLVG